MLFEKNPIKKVQELGFGDHLCFIYENQEEHRSLVTSFLRDGLLRGEKVIYVNASNGVNVIMNYLADEGIEVDVYLESGQMRILNAQKVFLRNSAFDPGKVLTFLRFRTEQALDEGYCGLRMTSEMDWALKGLPGSQRLFEYETKLTEFVKTKKLLTMCQYNKRHCSSVVLLYVIATHPIVAVGTKISNNPFYLAPPGFLGQDDPEKVLNYCLGRLSGNLMQDQVLIENLDAANEMTY